MRVLYLAGWLDVSTRLLIERVGRRSGISAALLSSCDESLAQVCEHVEAARFRSRGKVDPMAVRQLRQRILEGGFDVVHAMSSRLLANALLATHGLGHPPAIGGFVG